MKIFFCLIIISFFIISCDENLSNEITPVGNAKLKRVLMYVNVDDEKPISIVEEYEYDSLDRISRVSSPMYEDGEIVGTISYDLYKYNFEGQLIKKTHFHANKNAPTGFLNLKNYNYIYGKNGKKIRENIGYPHAKSSEFFLYKYDSDRLVKIEKYNKTGELERYVLNDYDNSGKLIKESSYGKDNHSFGYTQHFYTNGLNTESKVFGAKDMVLLREIYRTYDKNNNLIILESNEIAPFSSMMSHVLKYEYY